MPAAPRRAAPRRTRWSKRERRLAVPRMLREAQETLLCGKSRGMRPRLSIRICARMLFRENNKVTGKRHANQSRNVAPRDAVNSAPAAFGLVVADLYATFFASFGKAFVCNNKFIDEN